MSRQDKPLRECRKGCVANVGGQCAVADCRGPVMQFTVGRNRTLEASAQYYSYMRRTFDEVFDAGYIDNDTEE